MSDISPPPDGKRDRVPLRDLPSVHRLLEAPVLAERSAELGGAAVKAAIAAVLDEVRVAAHGDVALPPFERIVAAVDERLERSARAGLVAVINATGVLLHTNLGRAPLAPVALAAFAALSRGYSNLEFDLDEGVRGSRYELVGELLAAATGGEDSLVVNNCAAAILLMLDTFAKGREVVVARGEAIEIGGGFRLPDVLARSGARLVDVGSTNKTRIADVERALGPNTALLFRSHRSNFRIEGFVESLEPRLLASLGRRAGIPVVEDLGSGALVPLERFGLPHERTVGEALADGLDLVAFSGDKLLGGPQAGIVVGRRALIARMRANPLLRALRVDKATLAALGATLRAYLRPEGLRDIPLYAMLGASEASLR
ncbi:MAG: L-seryl-tRNA(Sec) selenium transferase, partial [Candidatus Dormibacteria bacterium]